MNEPQDLNNKDLRDNAVRAARGLEKFDVLIINGQIVDMITGRLRKADIGIVGQLIASVHAPGTREDALDIVDANDCCLSPGLIDMHMHVESSMITPAAYCEEVLPRGVTTIVWDPHEFGNTCTLTGIDYAIQAANSSNMRIITLAPSCVPSAPGFETTGGNFTPDVLKSLLDMPDIHGVAEVMSMQAVLDRDPRISGIIHAGLDAGKRICGHARGLSGASLNAYAAAGIETDHELTNAADLIEKLQAGLTIEMRGSHDHLLPQFVEALNELGHMPQTLTLCTDDIFIDDLVATGGLDDVVRRLVRYGLDPINALQAATLNAATRLGRSDLGLIAPGKRADIVLFGDLKDFDAKMVFTNGKCVARDGTMSNPSPTVTIPDVMRQTMNLPIVSAEEFYVRATGEITQIATIERPRFTQWGSRNVEVNDGIVVCPDDMTRMAVINRFGANTKPRMAFLSKWGQWRGAFATSVSHDAHNLTIFGGDEKNMAIAANAVREMGGGLVVVANAKILARLALPVAGLISEAPTSEIAVGLRKIRHAMDEIVTWEPPFLVFKACFGASLVCNSGPHLSDMGIVDTATGQILTSPVIAK